jgi:hypothetical protein
VFKQFDFGAAILAVVFIGLMALIYHLLPFGGG